MVVHGHDQIPLVNEGGSQSDLGSNQSMLHSPIEIAGYAKGIESPIARQADVLVGYTTAAASDEKRMDASAVNGNASIQKQRSFDSKLSDLERMLVVRQKMDPDSPKTFDDIIRTQIETLVPAFDMGNRESSIATYVKRLAIIRQTIFSQWKPMDHNGWNGDGDHSTKRIDQIIAELMRILDVESIQTVDAFIRARAKAVQMHRVTKDEAADLQVQVADLRKDLEQANEKIRKAQSEQSLNVGVLTSNADAWATSPSFSVPTKCAPSISNPSIPDTIRAPVEASNYGPSLTSFRPIEVATSSFPQVVPYTPPTGPGYAAPSGLFGSPSCNPVDQRHYGYGSVGYGLGRDDRSSFGLFNPGIRPMETQMPEPPLNMPPPGGFHTVEHTGKLPYNNTNVWPAFTSMPPNVTTQAFIEAPNQMREASITHSRGQHGLTRASQGSRRRGVMHSGCEHHERGEWVVRRGRTHRGRDSRNEE